MCAGPGWEIDSSPLAAAAAVLGRWAAEGPGASAGQTGPLADLREGAELAGALAEVEAG